MKFEPAASFMFGEFERLMFVAFDLQMLWPDEVRAAVSPPVKVDGCSLETRNQKRKKFLPQNQRWRCFQSISGESV
jgi:hypothetical protein